MGYFILMLDYRNVFLEIIQIKSTSYRKQVKSHTKLSCEVRRITPIRKGRVNHPIGCQIRKITFISCFYYGGIVTSSRDQNTKDSAFFVKQRNVLYLIPNTLFLLHKINSLEQTFLFRSFIKSLRRLSWN